MDTIDPFDLVEASNLSGLRKYVAGGSNLNVQSEDTGESLLSTAVDNRDVTVVQLLLEAGCDPNFQRTVSVPLITAAGWNEQEIVDLLLGAGANVNMLGEDGDSPLIAAACAGSLALVKQLVKAGAKPKQRDLGGKSALICAAEKDHREICEYLSKFSSIKDRSRAQLILDLNKQGPPTEEVLELIRAAGANVLPIVKDWIENEGLSVNSIDTHGDTPLITAATHGSLRVAKYLIEKGADPDIKNVDGECALIRAAGACRAEVYDFLYPLTEKSLQKRAERIKREKAEIGYWPDISSED